jgi:predicted O-methyltransferase YrrM
VIATEKEPSKAAKARANWTQAGSEVEQWIDLREGDILETLKERFLFRGDHPPMYDSTTRLGNLLNILANGQG